MHNAQYAKKPKGSQLVCHTRGIFQETKVVQNLDFCVGETVLVNRSVNRSSEEKIHADWPLARRKNTCQLYTGQLWILMKQEMMGWQWHQPDHMQIIFAPPSRQITTSAPHHSIFTGQNALPDAQLIALKHWRKISDVLPDKTTVSSVWRQLLLLFYGSMVIRVVASYCCCFMVTEL